MIIDFNSKSNLENWHLLNDTVMGGVSKSTFELNKDGHAVFSGSVSLKNNGGFASVRLECPDTKIADATKASLKIKGDGKSYQLRLKESTEDYYTYIASFPTTGEWETVEIELDELIPSFKGSPLNMDNFDATIFDELAIFIGNEELESFTILIDSIEMK